MSNQASSDQLNHITGMVNSHLTEDRAQGVITNGDLLSMFIEAGPVLKHVDREKFREALNILINPYASEITESSYSYPANYEPKTVAEQIEVLQKIYKNLNLDASQVLKIAESIELPDGAEFLQVVPKLSAIAKAKGIRDPYGSNYGKCLEIMLLAISTSRTGFKNYREGALTKKHVRLLASTRRALIKLEKETLGDFLVIPMQSGLLYRGSSVRRAVWEIEHNSNQWALPSWVVGHHLLTNPDRLSSNKDLNIDCPGDQYSPGADGGWSSGLSFDFDDVLRFGCSWVYDVGRLWSSASGFSPECSSLDS